ncbi:MAG: hypothetical protein AVDCRST_MAG56-5907, partial [uncultured Cytophagales bacterium]
CLHPKVRQKVRQLRQISECPSLTRP